MSIRSQAQLEKLRVIGRIVRLTLDRVAAAVRPGVSTAELDEIGARALAEQGAESAPPKVYNFPGALCISVNEEAIHGIPGERRIREGDLVKLDLVAEKDGYFADAAVTVAAGPLSANAAALARCAESAFHLAALAARGGNRVFDIGRAVERETHRCGFEVMRELCGHGVGRTIHEAPSIPNYHDPRFRTRLTEGAGDHHRTDHFRRQRHRHSPARRLDHADGGRKSVGALRAHGGDHARGADSVDGGVRSSAPESVTGKNISTVVPTPRSLRSRTAPWCARTMPSTSERPMPRPRNLVLKKGSKARSATSSGIPPAVSRTSMQT